MDVIPLLIWFVILVIACYYLHYCFKNFLMFFLIVLN